MSQSKSHRTENNRQRQRREREQREVAQQRKRWLLIGGGIIAVLAVGALLLAPRSEQLTTAPADPVGDDRAIGPATAPVTIVEYADFGCTSCRAWHNAGILQQVIDQYGDSVRFVWRDFPVITPESPQAAEAARCAADQGKFWEYHDRLYAKQPFLDVDSLKSYAAQTGLDTVQFNQCLDSGQHQAEVNRDLQEALARRFVGVPTFLINDKPLAGPPTFQMLQNLIEPILARGS
jgi:protein-disulfide isomerase